MNKLSRTTSYLVVIIISVITPVITHASSRSSCNELRQKEFNAEALFSQHNSKLDDVEKEFIRELGSEISDFESRRALQKKSTEDKFKKHTDSILTLATTPEQKKIVHTYIANVKNISQARAVAIENAQQEYKDGIKKLFNQRKSIEKVLLSEYKESSKKVFEKTINDCEKGRSVLLFKNELRKSMEENHRKFNQQISATTFGESVAQLKIVRDKKIQQAQDTFTQKYSTLANSLRTSFSQ